MSTTTDLPKLSAATKSDLLSSASEHNSRVEALAEEQEIMKARANDPTYNTLSKELKDAKGEKIASKAHNVYDNIKGAAAEAAAAKRSDYDVQAEEREKAAQKAAEIKDLSKELKTTVVQKELKHNTEAAKDHIQDRNTSNPAVVDTLNAIKKTDA